MLDIRIDNVRIVDGTGAPARMGSIGVRGDRIVAEPMGEEARLVIDGAGKLLTPGFIDAHSHGDEVLGTDFGRLCKVSQGITTEIAGQCGESLSPIYPAGKKDVLDLLSTPFRRNSIPSATMPPMSAGWRGRKSPPISSALWGTASSAWA